MFAAVQKAGKFVQAMYDHYDGYPLQLPDGYRLITVFAAVGKPFALLAEGPEDVHLAVRGTRQGVEWVLDFFAVSVEVKGFAGVKMHGGFFGLYNQMRPGIVAACALLKKPLIVSGHSLGAPLATCVLLDDAVTCPKSGIVIASPRLISSFSSSGSPSLLLSSLTRVTNTYDIVTAVPTGFFHVGTPLPVDFNLGSFEANHALENYLERV